MLAGESRERRVVLGNKLDLLSTILSVEWARSFAELDGGDGPKQRETPEASYEIEKILSNTPIHPILPQLST